jgi:hypothetical protein
LGAYVEAHGGELVGVIQLVGPGGGEGEEVVHRELLGCSDVADCGGLVVVASEVDVLGGVERVMQRGGSPARARP